MRAPTERYGSRWRHPPRTMAVAAAPRHRSHGASLRWPAGGARPSVARPRARQTGGPVGETDARWMAQALAIALEAGAAGEVPVGAVLVSNGAIVASSPNRSRRDRDATAHAELL